MVKAQSLKDTAKMRTDKLAEGKKYSTEQEELTLFAFRAPKSWPKRLKLYAIEHDTSVQAMLQELIAEEMKRLGI